MNVVEFIKPPATEEIDYFGGCPVCGKTAGYVNVGKSHFGICDAHHVYWDIGWNLFSSWQDETEDAWRRNCELLGSFAHVEPIRTVEEWSRSEAITLLRGSARTAFEKAEALVRERGAR